MADELLSTTTVFDDAQWSALGDLLEERNDRRRPAPRPPGPAKARSTSGGGRGQATRERNQEIADLGRNGRLTYQEIADRYGVTRERVRQILKNQGIDGGTRAPIRANLAAAEEDAIASRARSWARLHPGGSIDEAAAALGFPPPRIRAALGDRVGAVFVREAGTGRRRCSDDDLYAALAAAAADAGGPLSGKTYDAWAATHGGPSRALVMTRSESWRVACAAAGVVAAGVGRGRYTRRWSEDELVDVVGEYLRSSGATGSWADFGAWATDEPGRPSPATVRNRLGSWGDAKRRALYSAAFDGSRE